MAKVLRIPCHDNDSSFVLVHVNSSSSGPSRSLDLTLVGTEGTAPYVLTLKQSKVSSLKAKNGPCTQDEWSLILQSILLDTQASDSQTELLDGVETVASVEENKTIDITIRKRTEGITQRLGALSLPYDENQEIELFEWCGIAVQATSNLANELASFKSRFRQQQETISKLDSQLEELVAAKAGHEIELLEKFRDLLNEKKAKIRDQQRLLARAKVDPKNLGAVQASRKDRETTATSSPRTRKRKADHEPQIDEDGENEDDRFEKMDVDVDQVPNDSDQQDVETPDEDEDEVETADEDDADIVPQTKLPAAKGRQAGKGKGKVALGNSADHKSGGNNKQDQNPEGNPPKTPPRRELPFAKKNQPHRKPPVEDEETASEDDGL